MKIQFSRTGKILTILLFLVHTASIVFAEEPRIIKVVGKAEISNLKTEQASPAAVDVKLKPGDTITVAGKGDVIIQIGKNTVRAHVKENTKIEYSGKTFFRNVQCFELYKGWIRFKIEKGNKLDLKTPHMVASVRGTEFIALATSKASSVSVLSGKVLTKDIRGHEKMLEANTYAVAGPKGMIETGKGRASQTMTDNKDESKKNRTDKPSTDKDQSKKDAAGKNDAGQEGSGKSSSDRGNSAKGDSSKGGSGKGAGGKGGSDKGGSDKGNGGKGAAGKSNNTGGDN